MDKIGFGKTTVHKQAILFILKQSRSSCLKKSAFVCVYLRRALLAAFGDTRNLMPCSSAKRWKMT